MNWNFRLNEIVTPKLFQVDAVAIPNQLWKLSKQGVLPMFRERLDVYELDENDVQALRGLGEWLMMITVDDRTAGYADLLPFDPSAVLFATKWIESGYVEYGEVAVGFDERGDAIKMPTKEFLRELVDLYPRLSVAEVATSVAREIAMERLYEGDKLDDNESGGMSSEEERQKYCKQLSDLGIDVTIVAERAGDLLVNQNGSYLVADVHNELQHHYTYLDFVDSVKELLERGVHKRTELVQNLYNMYAGLGATSRDISRWLRDMGY